MPEPREDDTPAADGTAARGAEREPARGPGLEAGQEAARGPEHAAARGPAPGAGQETGRAAGQEAARAAVPRPGAQSWVRLRLRAAPLGALALAVLVLVTAFLAAALPRAVDRYQDTALRDAVRNAAPRDRGVSLAAVFQPQDRQAAGDPLAPGSVDAVERAFQGLLRPPLRIEKGQVVAGVRSGAEAEVPDPEVPRLSPHLPGADLVAQAGLASHVRVVEGRLPRPEADDGQPDLAVEAVVTEKIARTLHLKVGQAVHPRKFGPAPLTVRISGIVAPLDPTGVYWTEDDDLLAPEVVVPSVPPGSDPKPYWHFTLLLDRTAAQSLPLLGTGASLYWHHPVVAGGLTAHDVPALQEELDALGSGPPADRLTRATGSPSLHTEAGIASVLTAFTRDRAAARPLVLIAAVGVGTAAVAVLLMAAGLAADRRRTEIALLRSRGGSLLGIFRRLAAETAVAAVPAGAAGTLLALAVLPTGRYGDSVLLGALVTAVGALALPVRGALAVRRARPAAREDVAQVRPSRRRLVVELTVTVLVVGAVVALRRRGTSGGSDPFLAAAPVLVAVAAALVLLRLYPLPLRWLARPAARLTGAVTHLGLARAGRAPAGGQLPLLAMLVALTVASFGGSVLAGIDHGRDRAATLAVGADARVDSRAPLGADLKARVAKVPGVGDVVGVRVEPITEGPLITVPYALLIVDDAAAYARLTRATGLPAFPTAVFATTPGGGPLPAVVSPKVAAALGGRTAAVLTSLGNSVIRPAATVAATPAAPTGEFAVVLRAQLDAQHRAQAAFTAYSGETTLLATAAPGRHIDAAALRAANKRDSEPGTVLLRAEQRSALTDSAMQRGARGLYLAAVAAGAAYSALALLLSLLVAAPGRATLLARLRTMGMTRRQSRRLVLLEMLPQVLLAAAGGVLAGLAVIPLLGPGVDLHVLAFGGGSFVPPPGVGLGLRADPWSLVLPSAGLLLLACAVLLGQAWATGRRRESTELRAGDRTS